MLSTCCIKATVCFIRYFNWQKSWVAFSSDYTISYFILLQITFINYLWTVPAIGTDIEGLRDISLTVGSSMPPIQSPLSLSDITLNRQQNLL